MSADNAAVDVPPQVFDFLRDHNILTLATASPSGVPRAATQVYVSDGLQVYFCTRPDSRSAQHIDQNPAVGFTIDEYAEDWSKTKGIQGSGDCRTLLDPGEINRVVGLFQAKFPFLAGPGSAGRSFGGLSFFRITPSEVQFIDNESAGGEAVGQSLGVFFRRSLVYSVFRGLPPQTVDTIAGRLQPVQVNSGEIIVRQGAPADKFFIIVDGEVEVVREEAGSVRHIATRGRGEFFGEIAILRETPRTATVRAVKPTTLMAMDREMFRSVVSQALETTEDFARVVQRRLEGIELEAPR
jgi:uncharacterized protein YhbP (UPF0306 family)